jgi:hypothetical protein
MDQATTVTTIRKGDQGNPKSGRTEPRTRLGGDKPRSPPTRSRDPLAPPRAGARKESGNRMLPRRRRGGGASARAVLAGGGGGRAQWWRGIRMRAGRQELGLEFGREGRKKRRRGSGVFMPLFLSRSLAFRFIIVSKIINNNEVLYLRGIPWIWSSGCLTRLAAKGTSSNSKASRLLSLFGHFQCRHRL